MWLFVYILIAALVSVYLARMPEKTLFSTRMVEKIIQDFVYPSKVKAEYFYNTMYTMYNWSAVRIEKSK